MADFFITFRETLEAGLVIGIVASYLLRTRQFQCLRYVWWGAVIGVILSAMVGVALFSIADSLKDNSEKIFESSAMMGAAVLLTTMLYWMRRQRHHAQKIEQRIEQHIERGFLLGIFLLILFSVFREGVETSFFLLAATKLAESNSVASALLGFGGAGIIAIGFFTAWEKISLRVFFRISTFVLILCAAGLFARGARELQDAGIITFFTSHAYNISFVLPETGFGGGMLRSLFGYSAAPSTLEIGTYVLSLIILAATFRRTRRVAQPRLVR